MSCNYFYSFIFYNQSFTQKWSFFREVFVTLNGSVSRINIKWTKWKFLDKEINQLKENIFNLKIKVSKYIYLVGNILVRHLRFFVSYGSCGVPDGALLCCSRRSKSELDLILLSMFSLSSSSNLSENPKDLYLWVKYPSAVSNLISTVGVVSSERVRMRHMK